MIIESERLLIRSLNLNELTKYIEGENPFDDLSITFSKNEIDEQLYIVLLNAIIPKLKKIQTDVLFDTLWLIIEKRFNISIGSIMFKGKPDDMGKVEIGYGTHEEFQNKGYMTEAVDSFCRWAFNKAGVKIITAETAKDNPASFKVLEKNKFVKFSENDKFYYWKLESTLNKP